MAVITIPSSFSPIAAAIDVFTQDRLAQQKRARQAEQDAWNLEARDRQREGWTRQDQMQGRQDLLWQRQQDEYNKQQAKLAALGDATGQDQQIYNTGGYTNPEFQAWGTDDDSPVTPMPEENLVANAFQRAMASKRMANTHGIAPMTAGKIHAGQPQDTVQLTDQQIAEAISALEDPQVSRTMKVQIAKQLEAEGITPTIINQVLGPKAAKTVHEAMSVSDPDYMAVANALHDPNATYVAESGQGVGYENIDEAGGEQADYSGSRTPQQYTPQDRLALHQRFYGKPANPSQSKAYYKGPKAVKEAQDKPIKSWFKAYDKTVRGDFAGDLVDGPIAAEMKAALLAAGGGDTGKVDLTTLVDEEGNNKWFSHAEEQQLMSNLWEAAQLIQRQYAPGQSIEMIFEDMYRNIGFGDEKLDVVDISQSISPFVEGGGIGNIYNDTEATFSKTPSIFNAQQMIQDYIKSKGGIEHIVTERNI
tara:strand:+ start:3611 stop:5038 length:1428 start_codon:yes stop_codon:yes gene_type:complete